MSSPKARGRGHPQEAARCAMLVGHRFLKLVDLAQDPDATVVIGAADLGGVEPTRGPVDQPCAQPLFELGHVFAGQSLGHAQPAGRGGKPTGLNHRREDAHAVDRVHGSLSMNC